MPARNHLSVILLSLAITASGGAQSPAPDSTPTINHAKKELVERVIANQKKNEDALDLYERMERLEIRKNPNSSAPAAVKTSRVVPNGTGMDRIPVGPDGHPADPIAYRAELEKLEKALALLAEGHSQRDAEEKYAKRRKDRDDLIEATHNAFLFALVAREPRAGRELTKYEMLPNPAYKPTSRFTAVFPKVHGFVWIDEDAAQLARIEGDVTGDISIGLFLGKIYKGSHFMQERYEVAPGLWLPSFTQYDFDGRKLFLGFSIHERTFYSNYRYIGPPKEALQTIRKELARAELDKAGSTTADP